MSIPDYPNLFKKILECYECTGYQPKPRSWLNSTEKTCAPLVAIALAAVGLEHFHYLEGRMVDNMKLYKWICARFKGNWLWVEGFSDAFDLKKHSWDHSFPYEAGHRVGRVIYTRLKPFYRV